MGPDMPDPPVVETSVPTDEDETVFATLSCIDGMEAQVVTRTVRARQTGELVEFAIMLQVRDEGTEEAWCDVERVDCAHGQVHADRYTKGGTKYKDYHVVPQGCQDDLDAALKWATDYIWDVERRTTGWR